MKFLVVFYNNETTLAAEANHLYLRQPIYALNALENITHVACDCIMMIIIIVFVLQMGLYHSFDRLLHICKGILYIKLS